MNLIESRTETMIRDEPVKKSYHHLSSLWLSSWETMDKAQDILGVLILHKATKGYRKLKFDSIGIAEGKFLEFVRNLLKSCRLNRRVRKTCRTTSNTVGMENRRRNLLRKQEDHILT